MKLHGWLSLALVSVLLALTPLAYASPPDPSWVVGLYDDDDDDDIVGLITSGAGVVDPFPLHDAGPTLVFVAGVLALDERLVPSSPPTSNLPRAPPAS